MTRLYKIKTSLTTDLLNAPITKPYLSVKKTCASVYIYKSQSIFCLQLWFTRLQL